MAGQNPKLSFEGLSGVFDQVTIKGGAGIVYNELANNGTDSLWAPVKISAYGTVIPCAADDANIYGTLLRVEKDLMCVVGKGNFQPFKGDVAAGLQIVAASATAVKAGTGVGRVVDKDTTLGIVWVDLG